MSVSRIEKIRSWFRENIRIPIGVTIGICIAPVILIGLFYALRSSRPVMDWATAYISAPIRGFFALLSSIYPFAVMEVVATFAGVFFIYYIVRSIRVTARRRGRWKLLGKRLLPVLVIICYIWAMFAWLWLVGYHATGFAERYEFSNDGVYREDLFAVTQMFADRASELAEQMERDENGRYIADRRQMFADSVYVFDNIAEEFPSLEGRLFVPKSMLYSWLMSITGYSGMYFALTGEAMINTQMPGAMMPHTVAHEHAHQLGIFAEDEANLVAILAGVSSDNPAFQYAAYMAGLTRLLNALWESDDPTVDGPSEEWQTVMDGLSEYIHIDWQESREFWATRTTANTGVNFLDRFLTSVAETASDVVDTIYEGFLVAQGQELGLRSYGAFVDMLVEYFAPRLR
ncbi:MAG: DUF3810 domain-containing protein [Oscillospiraceae bacterium]|nr:DUF3810 domain-containing protein [Oscillospiraceae bacterium]